MKLHSFVKTSNKTKSRVVMLLTNAYNPDDRVRNEAIALTDANYEVIILAWDRLLKKPKVEVVDQILIKRTRMKVGYGQGIGKYLSYLVLIPMFLFQIIALRPDIVHCHDFDTLYIGVVYSWINRKVKLVFDAHENYYMMMNPLVPKVISRFIWFLEGRFTKYADLLIASCEANAAHYQVAGAKNVIVIGNWKNPSLYSFPSEYLEKKRAEIGANNHLIITYIGSLTKDRNVIPLIMAVRERPDHFVIIGGTGGQESEISQLCSTLPNAFFPGYVHPDDVPLLTAISDVIYYGLDPSDVYAPYNAPNKLFEALAAGKPIIAGDLGGDLSNLVSAENCGILISHLNSKTIGEALDVMANSHLRNIMGENSRKAGVLSYNWNLASIKLKNAFETLLQT